MCPSAPKWSNHRSKMRYTIGSWQRWLKNRCNCSCLFEFTFGSNPKGQLRRNRQAWHPLRSCHRDTFAKRLLRDACNMTAQSQSSAASCAAWRRNYTEETTPLQHTTIYSHPPIPTQPPSVPPTYHPALTSLSAISLPLSTRRPQKRHFIHFISYGNSAPLSLKPIQLDFADLRINFTEWTDAYSKWSLHTVTRFNEYDTTSRIMQTVMPYYPTWPASPRSSPSRFVPCPAT